MAINEIFMINSNKITPTVQHYLRKGDKGKLEIKDKITPIAQIAWERHNFTRTICVIEKAF
jgi:hypothetical protein